MNFIPNCPNCGADEIKIDDMYDTEINREEVLCQYVGTCRKCHHTIEWDSCFAFASNINITDIGLDKDYDFYYKLQEG